MSISAVIYVSSNAPHLKLSLESVRWCDEIVVIDLDSTEELLTLCRRYTDRIFHHSSTVYVEPVRDFGIEKATCDWILVLDADEEVTPELHQKLKEISRESFDGWELPRKNLIFGSWPVHASWWPDYTLRFFRRGSVHWPPVIHSRPVINGTTNRLPAEQSFALIHHNYETIHDYVSRLNSYTSITVHDKSRKTGDAFQSFWDDFVKKYFMMEGYKDGTIGLHISLLQSMYESVLSMKLWEISGKPDGSISVPAMLDTLQKTLAYWKADMHYKQSTSFCAKFYWKIRRKLQI